MWERVGQASVPYEGVSVAVHTPGACGICICLCQAEVGIRDLVRSRGRGDVYKRQALCCAPFGISISAVFPGWP